MAYVTYGIFLGRIAVLALLLDAVYCYVGLYSVVCVWLSVCLLDTTVSPVKTAESVSFGGMDSV